MKFEDDSAVRIATAELVGMANVFKRLSDSCWVKCIPGIQTSELSPGEASCIDRCVMKYQDVQAAIGTQLQSVMTSQQSVTDNH